MTTRQAGNPPAAKNGMLIVHWEAGGHVVDLPVEDLLADTSLEVEAEVVAQAGVGVGVAHHLPGGAGDLGETATAQKDVDAAEVDDRQAEAGGRQAEVDGHVAEAGGRQAEVDGRQAEAGARLALAAARAAWVAARVAWVAARVVWADARAVWVAHRNGKFLPKRVIVYQCTLWMLCNTLIRKQLCVCHP